MSAENTGNGDTLEGLKAYYNPDVSSPRIGSGEQLAEEVIRATERREGGLTTQTNPILASGRREYSTEEKAIQVVFPLMTWGLLMEAALATGNDAIAGAILALLGSIGTYIFVNHTINNGHTSE